MKSIKEIYIIGNGPSSSHTIGPKIAAEQFKEKTGDAYYYQVTLYSSLAATGRGHFTDKVLKEIFKPKSLKIIWKPDEKLPEHPNGMLFEAFSKDKKLLSSWQGYSIGGGIIKEHGKKIKSPDVYKEKKMEDILNWNDKNKKPIWQYVFEHEETDFYDYLLNIWNKMKAVIEKGLHSEGVLPGGLKLERKSHNYYLKVKRNKAVFQRTGLVAAYALAVSEENAMGNEIVTAPTCGSSGVLPAVLKYLQEFYNASDDDIIKALATAGLIGNIIKINASISGAEMGCQGEIGSACAMTAAAACQIMGGNAYQIEYAAEIGMEHHLGLTCDPIKGLVQIPCIERNAFAATNALNCADYALLSDGRHRITFDFVIETMKRTGRDINSIYKETSKGGLAKFTFK